MTNPVSAALRATLVAIVAAGGASAQTAGPEKLAAPTPQVRAVPDSGGALPHAEDKERLPGLTDPGAGDRQTEPAEIPAKPSNNPVVE